VDLKEELIGILMSQRVWDSPSAPGVLLDFWTSTYQAIEDRACMVSVYMPP
jgi:hypothetical protein